MLALLLVVCNGFFVVAEFSLVKVRRTRLEELAQQNNVRAQMALRVLGTFDTYLGATQLGITLSSLALGWLGEPAIASLIEPVIHYYFPRLDWLVSTLSIAIGFTIITFLHIVLGELVPKSLAIQRAEKMALFSVWPLYVFHKLGYPVILLFNQAARMLLKLFGIRQAMDADMTHSEEELRMIVSASQKGGALDQMESELIDNVFEFADRLAREVMIPRQDMVCLYVEDSLEENMRTVRESAHTRYPLCVEDKDHIIGMIHIRDLIDFDFCGHSERQLESIMREILMVPESMSVPTLLQIMRKKHTHMAVIIDEYGGTAGLVAMEDLIEEIVGDIQDEHDMEEIEIKRIAPDSYEFDGKVLFDDVAELLDIQVEEPDEDTIGGYIFGLLGRRPEVGDQVIIETYLFEVLQTNGFRIMRVLATPVPSQEKDS